MQVALFTRSRAAFFSHCAAFCKRGDILGMWENIDIWPYEQHSQHPHFTIKFRKILKIWSYMKSIHTLQIPNTRKYWKYGHIYEEHSQHSHFTIKFRKILKIWSYEEHSHFTIKFRIQDNSDRENMIEMWSYEEHSQLPHQNFKLHPLRFVKKIELIIEDHGSRAN